MTNPLEQRLREIEKEASRLRKQMKSLQRKPSRGVSDRPPEGDPSRTAPRGGPAPGGEAAPVPQPVRREDDLFSWRRREAYSRENDKRSMDRKLAHYLTSGSFSTAGRSPGDRRVQRNKAIFMLIVALVAAFILFSILRYY